MNLLMKKALIIGYGISGKAAEKLLIHCGYQVVVADDKQVPNSAIDWEQITLAILSPGVPQSHPACQEALARKIPLTGEAAFALSASKQPCVAITGTNGKTTVTEMACHLLKGMGRKARMLGNIGDPLSLYFINPDLAEILVIELSSYQLETFEQTPIFESGVILNITPDHLDRYGTIEPYARAKFRLQKAIKERGILYIHPEVVAEFGSLIRGNFALLPLELSEKLAPIFSFPHDRENALAAYSLCKPFGLCFDLFLKLIATFKKEDHRIELTRTISGITFYNDSKGTNIDAVIKAVSGMPGKVLLIAGGVDKGGGYALWKKNFSGKVSHLFTLGEAAPLIEKEMGGDFPCTRMQTLEEAVKCAYKSAGPGDVVLLSPGCASFDMFKDYKERGELFKRYVNEIQE